MKKLKNIIKNLISNILSIFPMQNKIIFESHSDFTDNTRAVFDYMIQQNLNNKYRMIWLVDEPSMFANIKIDNVYFCAINGKNILDRSKRFYHVATAKYIIVCNRGIEKHNKRTMSINLWHGSGPKAGRDLKLVLDSCDIVLTSSEFYKTIFEKELHVPYEKLRCLGYPRNDWFFTKENHLEKLGIDGSYSKIVMWMPTFRKHKEGNREDTTKKFELGLPIVENLKMLEGFNEQLAKLNMFLIIKIHPAQDLSVIKVENLSNIRLLTNTEIDEKGVNLYKLVSRCDAMITDYSSIYVDYLLLDRPIGFTLDDIQEYNDKKGFVFEDPLPYMPGNHIYTFKDLQEFICSISENKDEYKEQRQEINKLFNKFTDDKSCERFCNYFKF